MTPTLDFVRRLLLAFCLLTLTACDRLVAISADVQPAIVAEPAVSFTGRVVRVVDGDTLTVLDVNNQQHTLRLAEIDAPERGQPWGNRARQALSDLVMGKDVSVQQTDTDRYGRLVARVFVDGEDVNRTMIAQEAAWAFRRYLVDQSLIATEASARRDQRGLWSMSAAQTVPPWDWRRGVREGRAQVEEMGPNPSPRSVRSNVDSSARDQTGTFTCGAKRFCRQMTSCAEAHFYLERCGIQSLDGNGDGQPCEVLCGTATRF